MQAALILLFILLKSFEKKTPVILNVCSIFKRDARIKMLIKGISVVFVEEEVCSMYVLWLI